MTPEHKIQNQIRLYISENFREALIFRANVGQAWTGNEIEKIKNKILIHDPRPFMSGLPDGFADLFGVVPVKITPEMVGHIIGQVIAIEVKSPMGRVSEKQRNFLDRVIQAGGKAGVARCVEDARNIVEGER